MTIEVNGRKIDWIENESVTKLLKRMKYTFPLVVVKINNEIVLRSDFKIKVIHTIEFETVIIEKLIANKK